MTGERWVKRETGEEVKEPRRGLQCISEGSHLVL